MKTPELMGRPRLYWNRKIVNLRLEPKLRDLIKKQSDLENMSRNMLVEKVLANYIRAQGDVEAKWEEKFGKQRPESK